MPTLGHALAPGFSLSEEECLLIVPSGITTAIGGIYCIDTTVVTDGRWTTIIAVNTTSAGPLTHVNLKGCIPVVAQEVVVGGTGVTAKFKFRGNTKLRADGTSDIAKGDLLKMKDDLNSVVVCATGDRGVAVAMEARTTNSVGVIDACLFGALNLNVD